MSEGRKRHGVVSLLLVVALLCTVFFTDAASAKHYTKAQKTRIGHRLMRDVKRSHGRVLAKRWFLKKASQVDWTLPVTIRLLPATNQQGGRQNNAQTSVNGPYVTGTSLTVSSSSGFKVNQSVFVFAPGSAEDSATVTAIPNSTTLTLNASLSNPHNVNDVVASIPGGANQATLDLGPSLGVRSIGLGGYVPANINFSDAFSGGQLGDVRLSIPGNSTTPSAVTTTSVPLLANTNANNAATKAPNNSIQYFVIPVPPSGSVSLGFEGCDTGVGAGENTGAIPEAQLLADSGAPLVGSAGQATLTTALQGLDNPITNCNGGAAGPKVGVSGVYAYANGFQIPAGLACTTPSSCVIVAMTFNGPAFNGTPMPNLEACTTANGCTDNNDTATYANFAGPGTGAPPSPFFIAGNPPGVDTDGQGGCGLYSGNGTGNDSDLLGRLNKSLNPANQSGLTANGDYDNVGPGPSYGGSPNPQDTVLRTGPLTAKVADPGSSITLPADDQGSLGIFSEGNGNTSSTGTGTQTQTIGPSGGKANLFGTPVNGLSAGNSVDVTVNLSVDVMTIARQVDGAFPAPAGAADETLGNISAYANCRQAWSGVTHDALTNVHLVGGLKISPAITADGHLRIAKTYLHSPYAARQSLAACLAPYQLYMQGNPFSGDTGYAGSPFGTPGIGPNLLGGSLVTSNFNPLVELTGSALAGFTTGYVGSAVPSKAPTADCNATTSPLNRNPFNVTPFAGGTGLTNILQKGAAVAVSADLRVTNLEAEALVGNITGG